VDGPRISRGLFFWRSENGAGVKDSAPYRVGLDWFVDRTATLLPLCKTFKAVGNYSLRSTSLDPVEKKERIAICRGGAPVAPYAGPCAPK
jgi:hypothetical protein